jgi:metal-sulfur cluster biosynthetic enzyme
VTTAVPAAQSAAEGAAPSTKGATSSPAGEVDIRRVRAVAGGVKDPEVRTSIVDLGLLDEVEVDGGHVTVRFHLTSPLCPHRFAGQIGREIRGRVARLPGVTSVEVVLQDHFAAAELHRLINAGGSGR